MEMAFLWFAHQKVDIAVIETGLGVRSTAPHHHTNVEYHHNITDQYEIPGDTLPLIAPKGESSSRCRCDR